MEAKAKPKTKKTIWTKMLAGPSMCSLRLLRGLLRSQAKFFDTTHRVHAYAFNRSHNGVTEHDEVDRSDGLIALSLVELNATESLAFPQDHVETIVNND